MKKTAAILLSAALTLNSVFLPVHAQETAASMTLTEILGTDTTDYGKQIYLDDTLGIYQADAEKDSTTESPEVILDPTQVNVMIDPGHATAYYNPSPVYRGYYESVMNWKLSNHLKTELEKLGARADLTKTSLDDDPDLIPRGQKSKGYDFFISMHSNASSYSYMDEPLAICYQNLAWTDIDDTSREIGLLITKKVAQVMGTKQDGIIWQRLSDNDRDKNGVKDDEWYGVLCGARGVGTPGILMEHSFHTNYAATVWLSNDNNLQKLAKEEAALIYDFFSKKKAEMTTTTTTETTTTTTELITDTVPSSEYDGTAETTTTTTVTTTELPSDSPVLSGDVDGDGVITIKDAMMTLEYYSALAANLPLQMLYANEDADTEDNDDLSEDNQRLEQAADVNHDGKIDIEDAALILTWYAEQASQTASAE